MLKNYMPFILSFMHISKGIFNKLSIQSNLFDSFKMDIEEDQEQPKNSPNKNLAMRPSVKSRMSNDSMFSFPELRNYPEKNYPEKISLESNISEKMRRQQNEKGLFEQLISRDAEFGVGPTRTYGSNPNEYKFNRMSEQGPNIPQNIDNNFRMSIEEEPSSLEQSNRQLSNQNNMGMEQEKPEPQKIICKCSKSKCLLMYCECFSKGLICNEECTCYQCRNNPQFQQKRQKARQSVLERDPNAFSNKLEVVGGDQTSLGYKRGCNCKNTKCFKKYCECFRAGVKCTYLCNCQNCLNGGQNAYKQ